MNSANNFDVILVGSGISSLTAAAILGKKGLSVCVIEKHTKAGGYMHCFNRFGERFDTGAHYIGAMEKGQPFYTLLDYLGVYDNHLFTKLDPNGFDVFHFPEFKIDFPMGYNNVVEMLCGHFPTEKKAITSFFDQIQASVKLFATYEYNDEQADSLAVIKEVETSLSTILNKLTQNKKLIAVLSAYCTLHGVKSDEVPFGFHAIMMDSLIRGAYGFTNGGDALTDNFLKVIRAQGGQVFTNKSVIKINTENKLATSVTVQGKNSENQTLSAKWVISGIHPKSTFELVDQPEIFSPSFRQRLKKIPETIALFGIYGLHNHSQDFSVLKNYYYFNSENTSDIFEHSGPDQKPNAVFLCPSTRTERPAGAKLPLSIYSVGPVEWFSDWRESKFGKRPAEYQNIKNLYSDQVIHQVENFIPRFKDNFEKYISSTALTNLHFNGSVDGSTYGIYHSISNTGARSLGPRTHIANLLLTGQSTLFPGILGAATSGLRSAGHIVGIKPILKELKERMHYA